VAAWIRDAARVVVLTGAGISAESGVPVFRGSRGLWRQHRPEDLATPAAFERQPELVWEWYSWRREQIAQARPNAGHDAIARLQQRRSGVTLLTQNVDGLHERAGSPSPLELHGNIWSVRCASGCGVTEVDRWDAPPRSRLRCSCGGWLRPGVVWFGEPLDPTTLQAAADAVEAADVVLVVGTSAMVYPVASLPRLSRRHARVVEINTDETPLSREVDVALRGAAGEVLPAVEQQV
jgi:NAD-dependent deacetylase